MDLWTKLYQYSQAVLVHMLTILAGCIATAALELVRRYFIKKDFPDRWYFWMLLCFLAFASFQTWEDQLTSNIGRQRDLNAQEGKTADALKDKDAVAQALKFCHFQREILSTTLSQSGVNANWQQGIINTCVVALAKINTPPPLETELRMAPFPFDNTSYEGKRSTLVALIAEANRNITPVDMMLHCEKPFTLMKHALSHAQLEPSVYSASVNKQIDPTHATVGFSTPTWPIGTHLVIWVAVDFNNGQPETGRCTIEPR